MTTRHQPMSIPMMPSRGRTSYAAAFRLLRSKTKARLATGEAGSPPVDRDETDADRAITRARHALVGDAGRVAGLDLAVYLPQLPPELPPLPVPLLQQVRAGIGPIPFVWCGLAISPLQIAIAYATVANGGTFSI